jgi:HK97 family phage prohead protease
MIDQEIRHANSASKLQVRTASGKRTLEGYAIVFAPAVSQDLGGFVETIDPNSVNLSKYPNVHALRGHDTNRQLASTASGTLKLTKDSRGLKFSFPLPNTSDGNDLAELYRVGKQELAGQCSFGFLCNRDDWEMKNGVVLRNVADLTLLEISVGVVSPAYIDTSAALRRMPATVRQKVSRDFEQERAHLLHLLKLRAE